MTEADFFVVMNPAAPLAILAEIPPGAPSLVVSISAGEPRPKIRIDTFGPERNDEGLEWVAQLCDTVAEFLRQPDTRAHAILAAAGNTINREQGEPS